MAEPTNFNKKPGIKIHPQAQIKVWSIKKYR